VPTLKERAVDPYGRRQSDPEKKQNLVPKNPRLWAMLVAQAKTKFMKFPSLPASKWVHNEYVKRGGTFVASQKEDERHNKRGQLTREGKREKKVEDKVKGRTNVKKPVVKEAPRKKRK
jgi:hypothetical protein